MNSQNPQAAAMYNGMSDFSNVLDRTQGHLILKWNAWSGASRLKEIGLTTLYCITALFFLVSFAIESLVQDKILHANILFVFAILTVFSYIYLRLTGDKRTTKTALVIMLALLCLFLLYTGGVDNTGPLWFFVFPLFALFVQKLWSGVFSVIFLLILVTYMLWNPVFGFDPALYSQSFKERFLAVYMAISVMSFLYAFLRASTEMELVNINEYLRSIADVDELTKLPNRRRMQDILYQEISRFRRTGQAFCMAMVDIDHFKSINDTYGHECGDLVIKNVASEITNILRGQDVCARWGGEEFLILLPDTNHKSAGKIAERLRVAIQEMETFYDKKEIKVTVSFGIQEFYSNYDLKDCLREADKKLYRAKAAGRNCAVI